jgi:hypothetical protein
MCEWNFGIVATGGNREGESKDRLLQHFYLGL